MDVVIEEMSTNVRVSDFAEIRKSLLDDPLFRAVLKQWREEDERLRAQATADRAANVRSKR